MIPTGADLQAAADRRERIADALQYRMVHTLGWGRVTVTLTGLPVVRESNGRDGALPPIMPDFYTATGTINGETFEHTATTPDAAVYGLYQRALEVAEEGL